jgi:hypothetical protein
MVLFRRSMVMGAKEKIAEPAIARCIKCKDHSQPRNEHFELAATQKGR